MASRTAEFVLGLIGGIFGFFGAMLALAIGGLGSAFGASGASSVVGLGWAAIAFSVLGIVGSVVVRSKHKAGGWMMIAAAVGGVISISLFFLLPFVLLITAGIMGLIKKKGDAPAVAPTLNDDLAPPPSSP